MPLFGEKCVRCGKKRTKKEYDGLPTCPDCITQLQAKREVIRSCPVDGSTMQKRIIKNVIIDQCPKCSGVWLDSGELELIQKQSADSGDDFLTGLIVGMVVD